VGSTHFGLTPKDMCYCRFATIKLRNFKMRVTELDKTHVPTFHLPVVHFFVSDTRL